MNDYVSEKYPSELRARLMENATSVRTEIPCPGGGKIVTLGFPGLSFDVRGNSIIDRERMEATLDDTALGACRLLVVLLEKSELPEDAWELLADLAGSRSIRIEHLPIRDYEAPDAVFVRKWQMLEAGIAQELAHGGTVALSCHYGAGRSGTIAAGMLMDHGLSAADAIATVRGHFPESIESEKQLVWLHAKAK